MAFKQIQAKQQKKLLQEVKAFGHPIGILSSPSLWGLIGTLIAA